MKLKQNNRRTTVLHLPERTRRGLRVLARGHRRSIGDVIVRAVDSLLEDERDLGRARKILKAFRPGVGQSYLSYRAQRLG